MITPKARKGRPYVNTTERTMAAEKRIVRVVQGLLNIIHELDYLLGPEHEMQDDRRAKAAQKLLKDMHRPDTWRP